MNGGLRDKARTGKDTLKILNNGNFPVGIKEHAKRRRRKICIGRESTGFMAWEGALIYLVILSSRYGSPVDHWVSFRLSGGSPMDRPSHS